MVELELGCDVDGTTRTSPATLDDELTHFEESVLLLSVLLTLSSSPLLSLERNIDPNIEPDLPQLESELCELDETDTAGLVDVLGCG